MRIINAKRKTNEKSGPVAVPLDVLPERYTMTNLLEISARGSLNQPPVPRCFQIPVHDRLSSPDVAGKGGKCRPLDHM